MRPKSRNDFTIAIICALTLEAEAVEALFDETYDRAARHYDKRAGDANLYINGRIGKHNVVLCYMPGMGKGSAASVASSLRVSYHNIRIALVVGICGGAPSTPDNKDIFLGDVIISDAVVEYDFGRQYPDGFQPKSGPKNTLDRSDRESRGILNGLKGHANLSEYRDQMLQHLNTLQQSERWRHPRVKDILFEASYLHKHRGQASCCLSDEICERALEKNCDELGCDHTQVIRSREISENVAILVGTIASADTVMKSGQHRDNIIGKDKVIGFEMEGSGVCDNITCLIIKGVCDYADSHKNKIWQAYAAATGACAAKTFLNYLSPYYAKDSTAKGHFMVPFPRNPLFVGRQSEICNLEEQIAIPDGPRKLAIAGLGGVGKTQVALELAYRMRDRVPECSIFWIPCTSYEAVEQAYVAIMQRIGIRNVNPAEAKERIKAYFNHTDQKWLLIFDNADDMDMWIGASTTTPALLDFLPNNGQGHCIFTSRNWKLAVKLASASSYVTPVPELDEKTGVDLLETSLSQSVRRDPHAEMSLLEQLTFLPLAVAQAAAYINENRIQISDYLLLLQEQEADIVELLSEDFNDEGRYKDIQNPVAMTWLISFHHIQKLDELAAEYLSMMACVNPRNIPQSFLPPPPTKKKMVDALGLLSAYSFITIQRENGAITLHRLVYLATRNWLRKEEQFSLHITNTADRFKTVFPDNDPSNRRLWREYLPHSLSLLRESVFKEYQEQYIDLMQNIGKCLLGDGRYNEAEVLLRDIMTINERRIGNRHPSTLTSMHNLASIYHNQCRYKEAEELQVQVLNTRKEILRPEHPETLACMHNLALIYRGQGRYKEAEKLQIQVLKTEKEILGPEHPSTLTSMHNLALTYWEQGQYKAAEELQIQVSKARKEILGPEHPDTLTSMDTLAHIWVSLGRRSDGIQLLTECAELRAKHLGVDHPHTIIASETLAKWQAMDRVDSSDSLSRTPHEADDDEQGDFMSTGSPTVVSSDLSTRRIKPPKPTRHRKRRMFLRLFRC